MADTSALGAIFFPAMEKDGYTPGFAAAVTGASSIIGPIIPPSLVMVVYAYVMEMNVGAMFAGGLVPGVLMGVSLMVTTAVLGKKRHFPRLKRASYTQRFVTFKRAFLPMLTPIIILGGILGGIFTPTEAAGVAVLYAFFLTIFVTKTLKKAYVLTIFYRAGITASSVLFVIGASMAFGWLSTISRVPHKLSEFVINLNSPDWLTLIFVIAFVLFVGMFLDAAPAILILGPILTPAMVGLGFDQLHFSILICVIITVGLVTPPMGIVLFLAASMTGTKVETVARELVPFLITHLIVIMLLAFIPELSLALPRLLGFIP